jgi:hypothetical protein
MYFVNAITDMPQKKIWLQRHLDKLVFEGPLRANLNIGIFFCFKIFAKQAEMSRSSLIVPPSASKYKYKHPPHVF